MPDGEKMAMAVKDPRDDFETLNTPEDQGKVRQIFMKCTGPETITLTKEELRHHTDNVAIDELQDWLEKYATNPEIAELRAAIVQAMNKSRMA